MIARYIILSKLILLLGVMNKVITTNQIFYKGCLSLSLSLSTCSSIFHFSAVLSITSIMLNSITHFAVPYVFGEWTSLSLMVSVGFCWFWMVAVGGCLSQLVVVVRETCRRLSCWSLFAFVGSRWYLLVVISRSQFLRLLTTDNQSMTSEIDQWQLTSII